MKVSEKLKKYIETRDRQLVKKGHWKSDELKTKFEDMIKWGEINVGGRATCGNKGDFSYVIYSLWIEIITKAKKLGYEIEVINIPQPNAWATKAGGFWEEQKYVFKSSPGGDSCETK